MVAVLELLDRSIALSSSVMFKAGTVRYVRIKGGGAGGMDRVRLRNNMPAPPGVNVQRGPKGGLFFDIAPDVDLDAMERAAQRANGGGGAPAGINPGPQMQGQPMRVANQPAPQPAGKPKIPHSASPQPVPDTAGASTMGGLARKLHNLRAMREMVRPKKAQLQQDLEAIRRNMNVIMQEAAAGRDITRNINQVRVDADKAEMLARDVAGIEQEWREKNDAVQNEKRRQAADVVRRQERARQNAVRRDEHDQRHHNEPLQFNENDIPGARLGHAEVVSVAPLGKAGARGVNDAATYKAEVKPGVFKPHHGVHATRVVYKVVPDEVKPEMAAYGISQALGWDVVPEVREANFGNGSGHSMRWADNNGEAGADSALAYEYFDRHPGPMTDPNMEREFIQMWVLDSLIGNTDRHEQNFVVDPVAKKVWAIDSGRSGSNQHARGKLLGPKYLQETIKYGRTFEYDYGRRGRHDKQRINYGPKQRQYAKSLIAHVKQNEAQLRKVVQKLDPGAMRGFERRLQDLYGQVL